MADACLSSTSHSATIFSDAANPRMSLPALPPAPIEATFNFSLGDLYPSAFSEGVLPNPARGTAPASRDPKKKYRLENSYAIRTNLGLILSEPRALWYGHLGATGAT